MAKNFLFGCCIGMKIFPIRLNNFNIAKKPSGSFSVKHSLPCDTVSFSASVNEKKSKPDIESCLRDLKYDIMYDRHKKIFNYFGIKSRRTDSNRFTISHYKQPSDDFTFANLGIDENNLMEQIITIEGDADFKRTSLKDTKNIRHIGGNCDISRSRITYFPKLMDIKGDLIAESSLLENIGSLRRVEGNVDCAFCCLKNLNSLEYVGGDLDLTSNYNLKSLGNVEYVGGDLYIADTKIKKAEHLKEVGGKIYVNTRQFDRFKNTLPKEFAEKFVVVPDRPTD